MFKVAKVCPVFKNGDKNQFCNYRPISILPSFSKIFEKAVFNRLTSFIENKKMLTSQQYGFRKQYSTYMALLDMYDNVSTAVDRNEFSLGIFIDLSKAFDTLNHEILLNKLQFYGVRGLTFKWFESYVNNRQQCVVYNNVYSNYKIIDCGVPQGSILGPLLFILYINDIVTCSDILNFILFADDINIFYSHKDALTLITTVNTELIKLSDWLRGNKLLLNVLKKFNTFWQ